MLLLQEAPLCAGDRGGRAQEEEARQGEEEEGRAAGPSHAQHGRREGELWLVEPGHVTSCSPLIGAGDPPGGE